MGSGSTVSGLGFRSHVGFQAVEMLTDNGESCAGHIENEMATGCYKDTVGDVRAFINTDFCGSGAFELPHTIIIQRT